MGHYFIELYFIIWYRRPIILINLLAKRLNLFSSFLVFIKCQKTAESRTTLNVTGVGGFEENFGFKLWIEIDLQHEKMSGGVAGKGRIILDDHVGNKWELGALLWAGNIRTSAMNESWEFCSLNTTCAYDVLGTLDLNCLEGISTTREIRFPRLRHTIPT